ncbi:MAG: tRNA dimethylallyltransferase, partial [Bacteroidia bacterium]
RNFSIVKIGLNTNRELLYQRINKRVDEMVNNGLLKEVESLIPYKHLNALQTVGYKEIFDYLDNKIDLKKAIELVKQNTRRFAKRQLTWFRRDAEIQWFEPQQTVEIINYINSKSTPTA